MPDIEKMMKAVYSAQSITEMYFLEHGYGTPAEANALAHRVINQLASEGHLP